MASPPMPVARRRMFVMVALAGSLFVGLLLCELAAIAYTRLREGHAKDLPRQLASQGNDFVLKVAGEMGGYEDTLAPHPYLTHVHRPAVGGGLPINNVGLFGRDMPLTRDPNYFTILVTGGSVACQLAGLSQNGSFLEKALADYRGAGNDRPIRIINGADGGWRFPLQAITVMMNYQCADAVITLDGFNEHQEMVGNALRLDYCSANYYTVSPLARYGPGGFTKTWLYRKAASRLATTPVINRLHLTYYLQKALISMGRRAASADSSEHITAGWFSLPSDWPEADRREFNLKLYADYLRSIHFLLEPRHIPHMSFLQPVPALHRQLSAEEKQVVGDLIYAPTYVRLELLYGTLAREGLPVRSLARIFETEPKRVYADTVHCWVDPVTGESEGYQIMSHEVIRHLVDAGIIKKAAGP